MKYLLIALLLTLNLDVLGQEIAVTERGDSVMLKANGTWDYLSNFSGTMREELIIEENDKLFKLPKEAEAEAKGLDDAYRVYYDNEVWRRISPAELNEESDLSWSMNGGDAYAMVIFEEIEIDIEDLSQIAFDNAREISNGMEMISREYRNVNGKTLICMEMAGVLSGMKVSYYSYYFSYENGSIQFHTFTGTQVLEKYRSRFEDMLNGLIIPEG
jgi:hypothetical protein